MTLTNRQKSLSTIAGLEAKGDLDHLYQAIDKGLDNGLNLAEIKEALSQLYAYTGFPRSLNALGILQKVHGDRKAENKITIEGKDGKILPDNFNSLKTGTDIQTKLSGKPFNYTFAPRIDYYLKAHLFGDIFANDILSPSDREIVTVSAIASLPGCENQLAAHCYGALNMGVKKEELKSIPEILEKNTGSAEAARLREAIAKISGTALDKKLQPKKGIENSPWPIGKANINYAQFFDGNSYLASFGKDTPSNVTFEPGCRNHWHIHHKSVQVLVCVAGCGWYQEWGQKAVELLPGSVIPIPAEVKHWHGATKESWFQHLAYMTAVEEGASNEWLEPVSQEDYNKLP